jgi:hypothetical protein
MLRLRAGFATPLPGGFGLRPATEKCRCRAPEGEHIDRKMCERLRTVFRRVDRKIRQGRFASAQRFSALYPLLGERKKDGRAQRRQKNKGSGAMPNSSFCGNERQS